MSFFLRRLGHALVVVFGVVTLVFVVTRLIGDPVSVMLPMDASPAEKAQLAAKLGLDRPILDQYASFLGGLARFDLGQSLWQARPSLSVVTERLPLTLTLVAAALGLATLAGLALGLTAAARPGGIADRLSVVGALAGLSIPPFWLGLLLIVLFAVQLRLLPASGAESAAHLVLPALTLALPSLGRIAMMTRTAVGEELERPWIRTAEAKGMTDPRILLVHALRNAAIPLMTFVAWELARMLAGYTVVVETVFALPGVGFLAIQAMERQDVVLLQAVVFVVALEIVLVNILVDLAAKAIDPRIRL